MRRQEEVGRDVGHRDRDQRGDPDEMGERVLQVEVLLAPEEGLAHPAVYEIAPEGRDQHQDAHGEEPDDQGAAQRGIRGQREGEERDQGDAGHAVRLKTVGGRPDRVARIVAGAVGDDAGIARIVLRQVCLLYTSRCV